MKTPDDADPKGATNTDSLAQRLAAMGLPFMHQHYQQLARTAADKHWSHIDYLAELVNGEAAWRNDRSVKRRIKLARFPVRKTMDQFDWNWPTKINRLQIQNLFRLDFIAQRANVVFISGTGLGKSHIMNALGHAACLRGHSVLFTGAIDIVNALAAAHSAGAGIKNALRPYPRPQLLDRRARLFAHRQIRCRLSVPDHQPPLRAGRHSHYDEQGLQALGIDLQQRRHPHLGTARPVAPPRGDRAH